MLHFLDHERTDAYRVALGVARWVRATRFPAGEASLRDQVRRATESVVLNLAEGCGREGLDRRRHFRIAAGSAAEACAVLDLLELPEGRERQQELRRVVAMLCKMR
ncbi:four helix bundle protein [Myxococcota bacterium]|nr:four helix bundle protein [Myxococcota bacterium]